MTTHDSAAPLHADALGVSLTVRDLATSVAFFRDAVGFVVDREMERDGKVVSTVVRSGSVRILLNQDDGAKGSDRVKGAGLSLLISVADHVDAVAERIKAQGGTLDSEPSDLPWGVRGFRFKDPDGFQFAVSAPLAKQDI